MAYISEWLSERHQAKVADMTVEDTLANLKQRSKLLDEFIPFKTYSHRKFLAYVLEEINTIASLIPYGVEPPITSQGTYRKITAELLKTGLSFRYEAETQWDMKDAMREASATGVQVMDSRRGPGTNTDLADYIFGTIERCARAQVELLDVITWEVLQTGKLLRTDPRSEMKVEIDYRNPHDVSYNHFPAALTGTARWDQLSTANGLQDLYDSMDTYIDTNGFPPDLIVMSRKLLNLLMNQQSTKDAATQVRGASVGSVSPELLSAALSARMLPSIRTFDEMYQDELSNKGSQKVRFLNTNRFVFVSQRMGQRAMGPTLESGGNTGVYVVTREISKFPSVDATQGVSTVLPVFADPKLLYSRQVVDAV
jgi:hypothetical protein